jgi:hypothetical protein
MGVYMNLRDYFTRLRLISAKGGNEDLLSDILRGRRFLVTAIQCP